ncbi:3-keto-disaccharide hydrolase [Anatilimnocola floriformis]|uniref:3-keto-disaccharide hydrolase n=1 Tax=Anatilimnocola floriformis TaxID=2948575 RepID=UPI0020C2A193|nr:DUF1080 domain-containing protein [Anatilimnocola floriformis]
MKRTLLIFGLLVVTSTIAAGAMWIEEYKSGIVWPKPAIVTAEPDKAPSDAVVLFDGTNLDAFQNGDKWEIADGVATAKNTSIYTKQKFGSCQIHVEFATPSEVKGKGQGRGNSGVYIMGRYEVQVLDSYDNDTYFDGQCASVYKQQPPMVNASRKPGEWQTLDIIFTAPKFDKDGSVTEKAYVTVLHNGVLMHNHFELMGGTSYVEAPKYSKHPEKDHLNLQFHGNPVRYRNIWIRENISPLVGTPPEKKEEKKEEKPEVKAEEKPTEAK